MSGASSRNLALFPDEPPAGPTVARARPPRGLVPIGQLARDLGTNTRTLKRRLRRLDTRLGGRLLVQLTEGGHHLVRLDVLRESLPELVTPQIVDEVEEGSDSELSQAYGVASAIQELQEQVARLTGAIEKLTDYVIMRR